MTTEGEAQTLAEEAGSQPPHETEKEREPSRVPPDPKALRDWKWSDDPETRNNVCPNGLRYINLSKGDTIWTGRCPGTPPRQREDGIPWRYGLNFQTAKSGWFPCTYATKPDKRFSPAERTEPAIRQEVTATGDMIDSA